MKSFWCRSTVLSVLLFILSRVVSAQLDAATLEFFDDDNSSSDDVIGFTEARNGFPPCNGFPEYRKIPVNQAFYLGAQNAGSNVFGNDSVHSTQSNDISQMLQDGIRYLDINLCKNQQDNIAICSAFDGTPSTVSFEDVLEKFFVFSRENVEQFFIIHIKSEHTAKPINVKEIETTVDKICKFHTEQTAGTDEYVDRECPFIYAHFPGKGPWRSMGELVNFDPEMAQWEGDGELVGVRTKFMLIASNDIISAPGYESAYITQNFWRPVTKKDQLKKECRIPAGGIGLEIHQDDNDVSIDMIEDWLLSRSGCNLNDSPLNTFFTFIAVEHYEQQLAYWQELERRMMDLNYAKWSGNYELLKPSVFAGKDKKVARDEL
ncbi:MAG: hypothetical protein EXX96DRAFT_618640 [Benjaminiella poitrasii]|nr:MAG: hypothetical protein EXX96DRAFT_618640 [Benjaminiella poitrasii]